MRLLGIFTPRPGPASLSLDDSGEASPVRYPFPLKDTLSSMASNGRDFGVMIFALLQAAFSRLFSSFWKKAEPTSSSSRKTYNLEDPQEFLQAWEKNPYLVMKTILILLDKNFPLAKQILMNIAADWKNHPERYVKYNKKIVQEWRSTDEGRSSRRNMIMAFNMLWKQLILKPDQLQLEDKICRGEVSGSESHAMGKEGSTRLTRGQRTFRTSFDDLEKAKTNGGELWDYVYAFLQQDERIFSDLHLDIMSEHVEPSEMKGSPIIEMDFGHMMERMLYFRNFHRLFAGGAFEKTNQLLLSIFDHLRRCKNTKGEGPLLDEYPKIKELVELASPLLRNPDKAAQIHQIIREMIQTIMPISKSSPSKSRTRHPPSRYSPTGRV